MYKIPSIQPGFEDDAEGWRELRPSGGLSRCEIQRAEKKPSKILLVFIKELKWLP